MSDAGDGGSGEFHRIATYFAPLTDGADGALNLQDDAALIAPPAGKVLATTVDTLVEGIHFVGDEPADRVARKALRVNLSDLAAMGAKPIGYLLSLSVPKRIDDAWISAFRDGLAADQARFDWRLFGGDSTSTPGPVSISITAFGAVAPDVALTRSGARIGDSLFVSGTIGDGFLGLMAARGQLAPGPEAHWLRGRYELPEPRVMLGQALAGRAHGAMDVSDGLVADLGHLCRASGVSAVVDAASVPLSDAAAEALAADPGLFPDLLTGGDDYELLISGPEEAIIKASEETGTPVTRIGTVEPGDGVHFLDKDGVAMRFERPGFRHS